MIRRDFLHLGTMLAMVQSGCGSGDARAREEAEKAKRLIASELTTGSSEDEIISFFRRHKWSFDFDDVGSQFFAVPYRAPQSTHTVTACIHVNRKRELVRTEVQIDVTLL